MNKFLIFQWTKLTFTTWKDNKYTWVVGERAVHMPLPLTHVDMKSKNLTFRLELIYD